MTRGPVSLTEMSPFHLLAVIPCAPAKHVNMMYACSPSQQLGARPRHLQLGSRPTRQVCTRGP